MKIYFLGICGAGMGNAALLFRGLGYEVCGADEGVYPPMSEILDKAGIAVRGGYDAARLAEEAPDLVVVGNALTRGNPEIEWLLEERRIPFTSFPAILGEHILSRRHSVVIAGTHGKTTTSAIVSWLLLESGADPGFLIGGACRTPVSAWRAGSGAPFVIEGDEYDSAFFDKRSKFIHYQPRVLAVNNLEFDHADIFRDLEDVRRSFSHLLRLVPSGGVVLWNGDDPELRTLLPVSWTNCLAVGEGTDNDLRVVDFSETSEGSSFRLLWREEVWAEIRWGLSGFYNARNAAMAALAAGESLFPRNPIRLDLSPLSRFQPVCRRQEELVRTPALIVVEDFGHHPTAVRQTLEALRNRYAGMDIDAVFEPRSNTLRTNILWSDLLHALSRADGVFIGAINRVDQLKADEKLDVAGLVRELGARGVRAEAFSNNEDLLETLLGGIETRVATRPRVVVFFSNGSFDGIMGRFVEEVKASAGGCVGTVQRD